jgi:hypothetical protein
MFGFYYDDTRDPHVRSPQKRIAALRNTFENLGERIIQAVGWSFRFSIQFVRFRTSIVKRTKRSHSFHRYQECFADVSLWVVFVVLLYRLSSLREW